MNTFSITPVIVSEVGLWKQTNKNRQFELPRCRTMPHACVPNGNLGTCRWSIESNIITFLSHYKFTKILIFAIRKVYQIVNCNCWLNTLLEKKTNLVDASLSKLVDCRSTYAGIVSVYHHILLLEDSLTGRMPAEAGWWMVYWKTKPLNSIRQTAAINQWVNLVSVFNDFLLYWVSQVFVNDAIEFDIYVY